MLQSYYLIVDYPRQPLLLKRTTSDGHEESKKICRITLQIPAVNPKLTSIAILTGNHYQKDGHEKEDRRSCEKSAHRKKGCCAQEGT